MGTELFYDDDRDVLYITLDHSAPVRGIDDGGIVTRYNRDNVVVDVAITQIRLRLEPPYYLATNADKSET